MFLVGKVLCGHCLFLTSRLIRQCLLLHLIEKVIIELAGTEEVLCGGSKVMSLYWVLSTAIVEQSDAFPLDIVHLVQMARGRGEPQVLCKFRHR